MVFLLHTSDKLRKNTRLVQSSSSIHSLINSTDVYQKPAMSLVLYWAYLCKSSDKFLTCLVDYFIAQKFREATRKTTALDVILINQEDLFSWKSYGIKWTCHLRVHKAVRGIIRYVPSRFGKQSSVPVQGWERCPQGLRDPDKQDPKRDGGSGGKCSNGKWQVALINKKKRNIVWFMQSTSGVLGEDGNIFKDKHKNAKKPLGENF